MVLKTNMNSVGIIGSDFNWNKGMDVGEVERAEGWELVFIDSKTVNFNYHFTSSHIMGKSVTIIVIIFSLNVL